MGDLAILVLLLMMISYTFWDDIFTDELELAFANSILLQKNKGRTTPLKITLQNPAGTNIAGTPVTAVQGINSHATAGRSIDKAAVPQIDAHM